MTEPSPAPDADGAEREGAGPRNARDLDAPRADVVISIDAMGGDRGPATVIGGMAKSARKNPDIRFILHGDEETLGPLVRRNKHLVDRTEIRHAAGVVDMKARPSRVMRTSQGTSMLSAIDAVRDGDATVAVSCGNTGALMALSMLRLRRAAGVDRPAIAVYWPSRNKSGWNIVLDVGADIRADPESLLQFAVMGAQYARTGLGLRRPRVGLLNVGQEAHKGGEVLHRAAERIANAAVSPDADFSYVGYVEGDDLPSDTVDVIVTDGFTGNVALKAAEGTAAMISQFLREAFAKTPLSRLAALLALTSLSRLKKRIDPRRVNGGVFLGLNGAVVKSHGDADATGFSAAIKLAFLMAQSGFADKVARRVAMIDPPRDDVSGQPPDGHEAGPDRGKEEKGAGDNGAGDGREGERDGTTGE